jgi:glycosidase
MLDFPLEGATRNVFAQGRPMTQLTDILAQDSLYQHPESLVRFLGNHDQSRFLSIAGGDASRLMMAETFLLTIPGIPHLYYGDEVALGKPPADARRATRADFPGGFPGDPANAFTPEGRAGDAAQLFEQLRGLLQFRKAHAALRRGNMVNLLIEQDRYAYLRSAPGEKVLIVLNRAGEKPIELEVDDLALPEGLTFRSWQEAAPGAVVSGRKLRIEKPAGVNIYWATTSGK